MPIFLWSTVVNQLQKPVVDFGPRAAASGRGGALRQGAGRPSSSTSAPGGSRRCPRPVGCVIVVLARRRVLDERRHADADRRDRREPAVLRRIGIIDGASSTQSMRFSRFSWVVAAGEGGAAGEVGEVRAVRRLATSRRRCGSWCTRSSSTMSVLRRPRPARRRRGAGSPDPAAARCEPRLEVGRRLGDHPEAHVRRARDRSTRRTARDRSPVCRR